MDGLAGLQKRILIYDQDSAGIAGFQRCRDAALAIVGGQPDASVIILTGSPLVGHFDRADHVDFVRLPGRTRRADGRCAESRVGVKYRLMERLRSSVIEGTARSFAPDVLIVDGDARSADAELGPTVALLRNRGVAIVTGLRENH